MNGDDGAISGAVTACGGDGERSGGMVGTATAKARWGGNMQSGGTNKQNGGGDKQGGDGGSIGAMGDDDDGRRGGMIERSNGCGAVTAGEAAAASMIGAAAAVSTSGAADAAQ